MGDMAVWALLAAGVLVLVVSVIVGIVVFRARGPSPAQRVSLHPIQLGVPFRFVLSPKTTGRHALWLEGQYHFEGSEMDEVRLDFEVSYDGQPRQRSASRTRRGREASSPSTTAPS